MKILIISKQSKQKNFAPLLTRRELQVLLLKPDIGTIRQALKFYPDILWIDEEPHHLSVTFWLLLKKIFMPWARTVVTARDNFFRQFSSFRRSLERFNHRNLDAVFSCGKTVSDTLLRKGFSGKIMEITPLGLSLPSPPADAEIDVPRLKESMGLKQKVVGYVGPLETGKGIEWLIQSVAKIPLSLSLLFVGEGPAEFRLKAFAGELGMESRIAVFPGTSESAMWKYYRAMDVLVLPSLSTTSWREPFNEVILDAMAMGVPVIGSKSGEIPYLIEDAGVLIPESDEKALRDAIEKIFKDEAFRTELIQKGKDRLSQFDQAKWTEKMIEFLMSLWK